MRLFSVNRGLLYFPFSMKGSVGGGDALRGNMGSPAKGPLDTSLYSSVSLGVPRRGETPTS